VREYLAALDESQAPPKIVSLTDPQARWTCAPGGPAFFAYSTNYLIDVEHGVIVDVEATPANRSHEVESTKRMIERVEATFALKPERLIGDMAYGGAPMLAWLVEDKHIEPHVPVWDKTQRTDGTLSSSDFIWDEAADEYRCPQGQPLRSIRHGHPVLAGQLHDPGPLVGLGKVRLPDVLDGRPVRPPEAHYVAKVGDAVSMPAGCRAPWPASHAFVAGTCRNRGISICHGLRSYAGWALGFKSSVVPTESRCELPRPQTPIPISGRRRTAVRSQASPARSSSQ